MEVVELIGLSQPLLLSLAGEWDMRKMMIAGNAKQYKRYCLEQGLKREDVHYVYRAEQL